MKWMKWIMPLLITAVFLTALYVGICRYGFPQNSSSVRTMDGGWVYETNNGQSGSLELPYVLPLTEETEEVRLTADLPQWKGEAYAVQFVSMEQTVEVLVDGVSRYFYGTWPDADDFVYRSAHHINQVPLRQEDSGGTITVIYRASSLFHRELGLLREIKIGTIGDLALDEFGKSIPYIAISFFAVLLTLLSLFIRITYRDMPLRENLCVLFFTVLTVIFFNSENTALWPVTHYAAALSTLIDWMFYYLDPVIHFAAWLSLYAAGWKFRGFYKWIPFGLGVCYVVGAVLSLTERFNFNLVRPFFMVTGIFFTVLLYRDHIRQCMGEHIFEGGGLAVSFILLGYYADYLKYCLMLLPMSTEWSVFLQVKLPFQFFTGIALIFSSFFVLKETLERVARQKADVKVEAETAQILIEYSRQQYESIVQRDMSLRGIKHDMQFYFRTASAMLAEGRTEEARQYLAGLGDTVATAKISLWCVDYVANITIGWYADQFHQHDIPFFAEADIPAIREEVHADISSVLSNALQNALEGCAGQEEPFVRLLAKPKGRELLLIVENRCSREICCDQQEFPTTKMGEGHGIGMASIKAASRRRHGYFRASAKDRVFRVETVLCGVFAQE